MVLQFFVLVRNVRCLHFSVLTSVWRPKLTLGDIGKKRSQFFFFFCFCFCFFFFFFFFFFFRVERFLCSLFFYSSAVSFQFNKEIKRKNSNLGHPQRTRNRGDSGATDATKHAPTKGVNLLFGLRTKIVRRKQCLSHYQSWQV